MTREILVCPDCDSANIHPRNSGRACGPALPDGAPRWRCGDCEATFEEPRSRLARHEPSAPEGSIAKELEDLDPEELTRT